jgi:ribonuclease PH/non-canonical purine NTP pyrophosphatase (RdgB/HAM1 family)
MSFERDYTEMAAGSVLVSFGKTRVLCTASIDEDVPRWMKGKSKGWVTAEYSMLPGSSPERVDREAAKGKQQGRTVEIQRLIARSLRAVCDMKVLGERQVVVDCDVLQADGGTRTASICGGYLALHDALSRTVQGGLISRHPLLAHCAAISVGVIDGEPRLDLPYAEDSKADVDMNVVMTSSGSFVEVQGTGEGSTFSRSELDALLALGEAGCAEIFALMDEYVSVQLVCASANPSKVDEIAALLAGAVLLLPRPTSVGDVVEDAGTLVGNARLKARAVALATVLPAVADDTGLFIDALDGEPGVETAYFAGPAASHAENRAKTLDLLSGVPLMERTAVFRTIAIVIWPDGRELIAEGECRGRIALAETGGRGWGYDPLFIADDGDGRTFAELTDAEKHALSHRGRAFRALAAALRSL